MSALTARAYGPAKRALDVTVALAVLALTAPVQVAVAAAVRHYLGKPVLFRQPRPGLGGRTFTLYKYRTMLAPDADRGVLTDAERLTPIGRLLRSTSLDELPTLWNVVRGEMSLVGPRPLLVGYLERYNADQSRRHEVRPGVTGLAQVSGRNALTWEDRLRLDVEYVDRRSFALDLKILAATVATVVRRTGVSAQGDATMPEFLGTPPLAAPDARQGR